MAQITLRDYLQETEDAISSKRVDEAFASCQYILAYFPESLETQRLLGEVYLAQGKLEDAQQAFDWVLTNDPENVVAYCSRALVSERLSDYDTALDCYQQAYELSRGNGQIRQAFNQLSEKAGQPGFMLSRAGLARLYMRGDLLAQAVQEWDIVLAMTPDRLDARTGLLEVYWRLSMNDSAIQLAEQILQDVPGCEKALLLLAYVIAPQDMLRSQELVKKAEIVDPDLVMAHDLFADQMAGREGDPFLKLLHTSSVTLGAKEQVAQAADSLASLSSSAGTVSADALASWGGNANWNNDTTLVKPRSDLAPQQEAGASAFPSWMTEGLTSSSQPSIPDSAAADVNSMHATSQWGDETWNPASLKQSASLPDDNAAPLEPWDSLQDALNNINPETVRQISDPAIATSNDHSWLGADILASSASYSENTANSTQSADESLDVPFSYDAEHESDNGSATPSWLSMLNHNEPQASMPQSSSLPVETMPFDAGESPAAKLQPEKSPPLQSSAPVPQSQAPASQPQIPSDDVFEQAHTGQAEADDDSDEEIFFGPGWLKTLGAASLDGTDAFDFSALAEEPSAVVEQPAAPEQKLAELASPVDQQEAQPSSEKDVDLSLQYSSSEEPQATQEDDAWATWQPASSYSAPTDQESYQPWPDFANQPQDEQSFWSLPQQESPAASNQEQPSWMSQLSQSSQSNQENTASAYSDWASQPSDPWNGSAQDAQDAHIADPSESIGQPSMLDQAYGDDPWNTRSEQITPLSAQEEVDPWSQLNQQAQAQSIDYNWLAQLAGQQPPVEPAQADAYPEVDTRFSSVQQNAPSEQEQTEQNLITTLEELEQKLLSHGFTPLEPNSLASIAQSNSEEVHTQPAVPEPSATAQSEDAEPSLSSALAELGNFGRSGVNAVEPSINEPFGMPVPNVGQAQVQPSEPLWLSSIAPVADPAAVTQVTASEKPGEDATIRVSAMPVERRGRQSTSPLPAGPASEPAFVPTNPTPAPAPAIRMNVLLDSELETTMKRPAVRLQPIQQQVAPRDHSTSHSGRSRISERSGQRQSESKGSVSYRERLVRGYQAQLIGDFDEAMQEYRLIIRNAPELLGEVVSNVRALLKLAPNYSAGYRVLGDAYMRQGEYLQAMESYNKALTMAKKAKG